MSRRNTWLMGAIGIVTTGLVVSMHLKPRGAAGVKEPRVTYAQTPLAFEVNRGQSDARVKFASRGEEYSWFFTSTDAVLALRGSTVSMRLVGANDAPPMSGVDELPGKVNYFRGNDPAKWWTNVPTYAKVRYQGVYRGIDLVYYGNQGRLEYDLILAPGADVRAIRLAFGGVDDLDLDAQGNLLLHAGNEVIVKKKPRIYQEVDGVQRDIPGRYIRDHETKAPSSFTGLVGFEVESYDRTRPLVIDPVFAYSTYLGGSSGEIGAGIAVDAAGNAYIVGNTLSCNFPSTPGSFQPACNPTPGNNADVFVTKLNPSGSALIYSTYLAGSADDAGRGFAVDAAGSVYVTGYTGSNDFPVTAGAFQTKRGDAAPTTPDAFVTKLNAAGSALVYSSFLGGFGPDFGHGIALDSSGNAYVVGSTFFGALFPTTSGAFQRVSHSEDYFVTKVNPGGSALVYSTLLGGSGDENSRAHWGSVAVDGAGNAYVTGDTTSSDFPTTAGAFQGCGSASFYDTAAFVTKLNTAGSALVYSTCLSGSGSEGGHGIAVDSTGNAYVTGDTGSKDFPTTPGAFQTAKSQTVDGFITKLNPIGTRVVYSTYLTGGFGWAIAVDASGNAFVAGDAPPTSAPNYLPLVNPLQSTHSSSDGFVAELSATGAALSFSTYLGSKWGIDIVYGIAVHRSGDVYVAGQTWTMDPITEPLEDPLFPTVNPFQASFGGVIDAFVARISHNAPAVSLDRTSLFFSAVNSGAAFSARTPAQTVRLAQTGAGTVTWTAASTVPWLVVSPTAGSGSTTLTIATQFASGLTASQTGRITLTFTGAANAPGPINVTLTVVSSTAAASPPFGNFDTPAGDATVLAGSIALTGWTLDNIGVKQVELWRDRQPGETTPPGNTTPGDPRNGKIYIANGTFVDGARPDVEGLYPTTPANYRAGWGYLMLTWGLFGQGNGTYKFYAFGVDWEGNTATIGTKTVVISNNTATKPFGSIDTPAIGGDASGPNFGWGLTPKVNGAATCKIQPSGVQYSIDSGPLQPVVYGDARTDIAGAFTGFSNTTAAGGHAIIDWTALTNGSHTIGWLITDDCNRADGVGSRFVNVTTGTALRAVGTDSAVAAPTSLFAASRVSETESQDPITVARGYGELPETVDPATTGSRLVEMQQGERIEIRLSRGFASAYQLGPSGQRRALPIGSSWDAGSETFYWQPAPGFLGPFRLVFSNGAERISVRVVIRP
jgi:hypothetical protein